MNIEVNQEQINELKNEILKAKDSLSKRGRLEKPDALEVLRCGASPEHKIGRANTAGYLEGLREAAKIFGVNL